MKLPVQAVSTGVVRHRRGRDIRSGRRERKRQDDGRSMPASPDRADLGLGRVQGHRHRRPEPQADATDATADADRVPGSAGVARPASDGRLRDRGAAADPEGRRRSPSQGRRTARTGRAVARSRRTIPARVLRRAAPTGGDRTSARPRPRVHRARRAGVRARRRASRPALSTCSRTCRSGWDSAISSSLTTCRSCATSATVWR